MNCRDTGSPSVQLGFRHVHHGSASGSLYAVAFDAAPNGIVITDPNQPDTPIVAINAAFTAITGYGGEEAIGRNCRFLQGPDTDPAAVSRLAVAIRDGREIQETLLNYCQDGTPFWSEVQIVPGRDSSGVLTHFVGYIEDVSARRWGSHAWARLDSIVQASGDAIIVTTLAGTVYRLERCRRADVWLRARGDRRTLYRQTCAPGASGGSRGIPGPGPWWRPGQGSGDHTADQGRPPHRRFNNTCPGA